MLKICIVPFDAVFVSCIKEWLIVCLVPNTQCSGILRIVTTITPPVHTEFAHVQMYYSEGKAHNSYFELYIIRCIRHLILARQRQKALDVFRFGPGYFITIQPQNNIYNDKRF